VAEKLTRRQNDVLEAGRRLEQARGYAPSVREIARELELSAPTVQQHLDALVRKGFARRSGAAFGLEFLDRPASAAARAVEEASVVVPVLGTIAAGRPIEAVEQHDDGIPVARDFARGDCFFLRVRGDSMRDDHILDGDLVLVRRQETVENGEIAVALLPDGTATLKRVYRERGRFRLQPANEAYPPIFAPRITVQGKVVSVMRNYG
jgi:repressor LexA